LVKERLRWSAESGAEWAEASYGRGCEDEGSLGQCRRLIDATAECRGETPGIGKGTALIGCVVG
jgi:hypothetical protein